jgi:hypothetical protein
LQSYIVLNLVQFALFLSFMSIITVDYLLAKRGINLNA